MSEQPPPEPQPPIPPRPPTPARQSRVGWIIVGAFLGVVLLCCIGALVLRNVIGTINTGPPLQPSPTATAPFSSTLVLTPHILTGPTLGGTQDAFTATFGAPVMTGSIPHYRFTLNGTPGGVCFCGTAAGLDGQQHLEFLKVGPGPGVTWTLGTKTEVVAQFLPLDAVYVRTIQDPTVGPILVYLSPDLAQTFPAAQFTDSGGGPAPPAGTFSVICQQPGVADCTIETGT